MISDARTTFGQWLCSLPHPKFEHQMWPMFLQQRSEIQLHCPTREIKRGSSVKLLLHSSCISVWLFAKGKSVIKKGIETDDENLPSPMLETRKPDLPRFLKEKRTAFSLFSCDCAETASEHCDRASDQAQTRKGKVVSLDFADPECSTMGVFSSKVHKMKHWNSCFCLRLQALCMQDHSGIVFLVNFSQNAAKLTWMCTRLNTAEEHKTSFVVCHSFRETENQMTLISTSFPVCLHTRQNHSKSDYSPGKMSEKGTSVAFRSCCRHFPLPSKWKRHRSDTQNTNL